MLLDFGWSEMLLIAIVALVFVGPKDLPKAMRVAGYWIRKARNLSAELQSGIDHMIREAELDDIRQDLKKASEFNFEHEFRNTIDPDGSLAESLKPPELPDFSAPAHAPAASEAETAGAAEILPPETYLPPPEPAAAPLVPADLVHHEVAPAEPMRAENAAAAAGEIPSGEASAAELAHPAPAAELRPEAAAANDAPPAAPLPVKA